MESAEQQGVLPLAHLLSVSSGGACRVKHGFPQDVLSSSADACNWAGLGIREQMEGDTSAKAARESKTKVQRQLWPERVLAAVPLQCAGGSQRE